MNEGYQERWEDSFENANFIAYTTYASMFGSQGAEPVSFEEWNNPKPKTAPAKPEWRGKGVQPNERGIPTAVEVSWEYKRQQEALMNSIP